MRDTSALNDHRVTESVARPWRWATMMLTAALVASSLAVVSVTESRPAAALSDDFAIVRGTAETTPDDLASVLLGPGVSLAGPALVNGLPDFTSAGHAGSYGTFSGGHADLGLSTGLVITANADAAGFSRATGDTRVDESRNDPALDDVLATVPDLCHAFPCTHNATDLSFSVVPTDDFIKFEYVLAMTEQGSFNTTTGVWSGPMFNFPDGFALFVDGETPADNCAVVPGTGDYLTMRTAGIATPQGHTAANRAQAAMESVHAYAAENPAWQVRFLTLPLTCIVDVSDHNAAGTAVDVRMVVADANDPAVPPAAFLSAGSVRFEDTSDPTQPPAWADDSLAAFVDGEPYADGVLATGDPEPTYSVSSGALPEGIDLDELTGSITGTPSGLGAYAFTITAANGIGTPVSATFSGEVHTTPVWVDETLTDFVLGESYDDRVEAAGHPAPTYAVTSGSLPEGIVFDAVTGEFTGTPTTAGPYAFALTASNGAGGDVSATFTGRVVAAPVWVDATLGQFVVGDTYTGGVVAAGDPTPTYSVTAGALPDGLTLDAASGEITGTPTDAGPYEFTLAASNGVGVDETMNFSGEVHSSPSWVDDVLAPFVRAQPYADGVAATGNPLPTYSVSDGQLPVGVTLDANSGAITGTPSGQGAYGFTISADNAVDPAVTARFDGVVHTAPTWDDDELAPFVLGRPYADGLSATAVPAAGYEITSGSLPDGVELDAVTGAVTGTPSTPGSYGFTITASNGVGDPVAVVFSGDVHFGPEWNADSLAPFVADEPYSDGVDAAGFPAPTYDVTSGALPAGTTLDPDTGAISGTPTGSGSYGFTITASNDVGDPVTATFTGEIHLAPTWTDTDLGDFVVGRPFVDSVSATGLPSPTYSVSDGQLPEGVTLDADSGEISGTPRDAGTYDVTITADNGAGTPATWNFSGSVFAPTRWVDDSLSPFVLGEPFADAVSATGLPSPTYSVSTGELPGGVNLDAVTGEISGTPSDAGTYDFTITAHNGIGPSVSSVFSSEVLFEPQYVEPPGETLGVLSIGSPFSLTLESVGAPAPQHVVTSGALPDGLSLDPTSGTIAGTPTAVGSYEVEVTADNGIGNPAVVSFTGDVSPPLGPPSTVDHPQEPTGVVGGSPRAEGDKSGGSPRAATLAQTGVSSVPLGEFAVMLIVLGALIGLSRRWLLGDRRC